MSYTVLSVTDQLAASLKRVHTSSRASDPNLVDASFFCSYHVHATLHHTGT